MTDLLFVVGALVLALLVAAGLSGVYGGRVDAEREALRAALETGEITAEDYARGLRALERPA